MRDLIKINAADIGGEGVQTVNARELHAFLESKIRFSDWIKKRVADYGFQVGVDFCRIELAAGLRMSENGGDLGGLDGGGKNVALESMGYESFGQQGRIEYAVTLDMAKELAMVERNDKGKQARQYFIACEKQAQEGDKDWRRLRHAAASSYKVMSEVLLLTRQTLGKSSSPHHFMNEARLINLALTGEFKGLDRADLSTFEMDVLAKLEVRNTALIAMGVDYQERKVKILAYMDTFKIANPGNLQLGSA